MTNQGQNLLCLDLALSSELIKKKGLRGTYLHLSRFKAQRSNHNY